MGVLGLRAVYIGECARQAGERLGEAVTGAVVDDGEAATGLLCGEHAGGERPILDAALDEVVDELDGNHLDVASGAERGVGPLGDEKTVMLALLDPVLEGGAFLPLLDQTGCDLKVDSQLGLRAWRGEEPFVVIAHPHALPRIGRDGSLDFIHVRSPFMEPAFR